MFSFCFYRNVHPPLSTDHEFIHWPLMHVLFTHNCNLGCMPIVHLPLSTHRHCCANRAWSSSLQPLTASPFQLVVPHNHDTPSCSKHTYVWDFRIDGWRMVARLESFSSCGIQWHVLICLTLDVICLSPPSPTCGNNRLIRRGLMGSHYPQTSLLQRLWGLEFCCLDRVLLVLQNTGTCFISTWSIS